MTDITSPSAASAKSEAIIPARLLSLADEWRMLDLQASMTEAEMARYDKLPLLMATALESVASRVTELEAEVEKLRERERFMRGISPSVAAMLDEYDTPVAALEVTND